MGMLEARRTFFPNLLVGPTAIAPEQDCEVSHQNSHERRALAAAVKGLVEAIIRCPEATYSLSEALADSMACSRLRHCDRVEQRFFAFADRHN